MTSLRVAAEVKKIKASWSDERIFQETRRIVVAELQNIIYNEYLPIVLGDNTVTHTTNTEYDDNVDASITNVFATAAYRFGHSLVTAVVRMASGTSYNLEENFFDIKYVELKFLNHSF